jgi:hypothetical protein
MMSGIAKHDIVIVTPVYGPTMAERGPTTACRKCHMAIGLQERSANPLNARRRPKHLLAGLLTCGCCGLRTHMMDPTLFKDFCEEFTHEVNRLCAWSARLA